MFDNVQSLAVLTASVLAPGSGALVNSGFELAKICIQVGEVLVGMEHNATAIKTQRESIQEDVDEFEFVVELLTRVQNQDQLTAKLQATIVQFHKEIQEYDRVVAKFTSRSLVKQLVFRSEITVASEAPKRISKKVVKRLTVESAVDGSHMYGVNPISSPHAVRSLADQQAERDRRCMAFVKSPELIQELSDETIRKEALATITNMGKRAEMQGEPSNRDPVLRLIKEKLWASSSAAVRNEVSNLPTWYLTEDQVDVDRTKTLGFGGDATIYHGRLAGATAVAVKTFTNAAITRCDQAKQRFITTMDLWYRLQHQNISRLDGACYLTAEPFVVMELCDFGQVDAFLRDHEDQRPRLALELLAQAAQGVIKMHSMGIVHGDLKCDNILVTGSPPQARLCDFDRSFDWTALKARRLVNGCAVDAGIEVSEAVRWLAPECVAGKVPSSASDVYSFGLTLYQALMGEPPYFDINNEEEVKACKRVHELPVRDEVRISDSAWALISQCCNATPSQRPTMQTVFKVLTALISQPPPLLQVMKEEKDEDEEEHHTHAFETVIKSAIVEKTKKRRPYWGWTGVKSISKQSPDGGRSKTRRLIVSVLAAIVIVGFSGGVLYSTTISSATQVSNNTTRDSRTNNYCSTNSGTDNNITRDSGSNTSTNSGTNNNNTTHSGTNNYYSTNSGTNNYRSTNSGTNNNITRDSGSNTSTNSRTNNNTTTHSGANNNTTRDCGTNNYCSTNSRTNNYSSTNSRTNNYYSTNSGTNNNTTRDSGTNNYCSTNSRTNNYSSTNSRTNNYYSTNSGTNNNTTRDSGTNSATTDSGTNNYSSTNSGTDNNNDTTADYHHSITNNGSY